MIATITVQCDTAEQLLIALQTLLPAIVFAAEDGELKTLDKEQVHKSTITTIKIKP